MAQPSIGVGMIGCGTVGSGVARLLRDQADLYGRRLGRGIELRHVLVRDPAKRRPDVLNGSIVSSDPDAFFATVDMPIVIEVAGGGGDVGVHVRRALSAGKHVVTANKSMLAEEGSQLFALARKHGAAIAFEASCGGGIPIITALQFGLMANRIDVLVGILNGTCNYILTEMTCHGKTYQESLHEAQKKGYAETDPILDVSGQDAAQKLAILGSLAFGVQVAVDTVGCEGINAVDLADIRFGGELGYDIKLLAIAERCGNDDASISLRVQPCFVHKELLLAQVHGPFNALSIYGHATGHTMYYGRGAGQLPTASAVVSDLLNVAGGWYPHAFRQLNLGCDKNDPAQVLDPDDLEGRFYLRISAMDVPGVVGRVSTVLGNAGISMGALLQHEIAAGQFVPVVIVTHTASQGAVRRALAEIESLDVIEGRPVCIRILDLPEG